MSFESGSTSHFCKPTVDNVSSLSLSMSVVANVAITFRRSGVGGVVISRYLLRAVLNEHGGNRSDLFHCRGAPKDKELTTSRTLKR